MLEFIKNLFKKKELVKDFVKFDELESWFIRNSNKNTEVINSSIKEKAVRFKEESDSLKEALSELEKAFPGKDLKVPPRVKHTVEGHRTNYIKRVGQFLDKAKLSEDIDYIKAKDHCKIVDEELNTLAKNTTKSYFATQHLFYKELEEVAKRLKKITSLIKDIKSLSLDSAVENTEIVKKLIKELKEVKNSEKNLKKEVEENQNKVKSLEESKEQASKKLQDLKESEDYKKYFELEEKKKKIEENKRSQKSKIFNLFSPLEFPMKKYERITLDNTKLIAIYLKDPAKALIEDETMKIIEVIKKMKENIENNSIELKDKKKSKTLKTIEEMTEEKLKTLKKELKEIEKQIKENNESILSLEKVVKEEKELKDKIKDAHEKILSTQDVIDYTEERIKNKPSERIEKQIKDRIKEHLEIDLEIE